VNAAFVLDSSVALAWCFPDESTAQTQALLDRMLDDSAAVPAWWFVELTNVLALAERKGRITLSQVEQYMATIDEFDLEIDEEAPDLAFTELFTLSRKHKLTAYDAVYLELARRRQLPLATLDAELRQAAAAEGVPLLGA
jgi:predicted nucleic acid-binding protein